MSYCLGFSLTLRIEPRLGWWGEWIPKLAGYFFGSASGFSFGSPLIYTVQQWYLQKHLSIWISLMTHKSTLAAFPQNWTAALNWSSKISARLLTTLPTTVSSLTSQNLKPSYWTAGPSLIGLIFLSGLALLAELPLYHLSAGSVTSASWCHLTCHGVVIFVSSP